MVDSTRGSRAPRPTRPGVPPSYGVTGHGGDRLPWDTVRDWWVRARNYWVATTRPDGRPHAAPVWGVWLDDALYFATDPASQKGRNLAASPAAVVHLESGNDVAILEGRAEEITDRAALTRFADAYEAKYQVRPDAATGVVYALRPAVGFTWLERNFCETATRWIFSS
ncbi:MAG TPA: pyridoxamine 5'-phosphate oxidase family protein [bacterium]|nr:pyridoxamine 5'-phosphate oxidase family protein [bacterium]